MPEPLDRFFDRLASHVLEHGLEPTRDRLIREGIPARDAANLCRIAVGLVGAELGIAGAAEYAEGAANALGGE